MKKTTKYLPESGCNGPSQSSIDVLAFTVTLFDKPKLGITLEELPNFTLPNTMLLLELFHDVIEPDDSVKLQFSPDSSRRPRSCRGVGVRGGMCQCHSDASPSALSAHMIVPPIQRRHKQNAYVSDP